VVEFTLVCECVTSHTDKWVITYGTHFERCQ